MPYGIEQMAEFALSILPETSCFAAKALEEVATSGWGMRSLTNAVGDLQLGSNLSIEFSQGRVIPSMLSGDRWQFADPKAIEEIASRLSAIKTMTVGDQVIAKVGSSWKLGTYEGPSQYAQSRCFNSINKFLFRHGGELTDVESVLPRYVANLDETIASSIR